MTDTRMDDALPAGQETRPPIGIRIWTCLGLAVTSWLIVLSGAWLIVEIASAVLAVPGASAFP